MRVIVFNIARLLLLAHTGLHAQEDPNPSVFFENRIKPILAKSCNSCHTDLRRGGLRLDSRESIIQGGNHGSAIIPGNPEQSLLIRAVSHVDDKLKMPLGGKLTDSEIDDLKKWVSMGAPWSMSKLESSAAHLFQNNCGSCHRGIRPPAGLDLTDLSKVNTVRAYVLPGKPESSPIWHSVSENRMPPGKPLSKQDRTTLQQWILEGAPGLPKTANLHWAFQPPQQPVIPKIKYQPKTGNAIDQFIVASLEKHGLSLSPEADKRTLIRRVSIDLTGLPPTLAETEKFLKDNSSGAYELMMEYYLASPQYGERWGQHWLDAAGYADSNGYFDADTNRPLAYKYRDYVIRSLNNDKPFDRFITEQIAGDELAGYTPNSDVTSEMEELLTATHFLRNGPDGTGESDGNPDEVAGDRYAVLEGNVQIMGSVLLGLTVQCARCHDHKFEPFSQKEYYQLQAILKPAYNHDKWLKPNERVVCAGNKAECDANKAAVKKADRGIEASKSSLKGLIEPFRKLLIEENLDRQDASLKKLLREALDTPSDIRSEEMKDLLKEHKALVEPDDKQVAERYPDITAGYSNLVEAIRKREMERPALLPQIAAVTDVTANPPVHHVLSGGVYTNPAEPAEPGAPAILTTRDNPFTINPASSGTSSGRRLAFAKWLTSPQNPTVARMQVNRIWLNHFGKGLVSTPDNFGITGNQPTHPELLDYLATEFVRSQWSMKSIHRLILMSATYRQSGVMNAQAHNIDPDNDLLWRYPLRRLEAEAVREAMLLASGELDLSQGGPYTPIKRIDTGQILVKDPEGEGALRRSIYLQRRRTQPESLLEVFDIPTMTPNCTQRGTSTVSLQSLSLLNSEFVRARSAAMARRIIKEVPNSVPERFKLAVQLAFNRLPTASEKSAAEAFLRSQRPHYLNATDIEERIWKDLCQTLLASNSFLYVE